MTYSFIDSHCHFDFPPFTNQTTSALTAAQQARVRAIIIPAVSADRFSGILTLAQQHPPLYAALGLHPLLITQHDTQALATLEQQLASHPAKLVALGEIGLDLFMQQPHLPRQQALLDAQLQLAKRYDLPVILHSRRSHDQLAAMLKQHNLPRTGVVHGFAGSLQQAQRFVQLGYKIGVGGIITYPRAKKTREVMARLPAQALLLETDAPDMPLAGWQGQPNRPERIAEVFATLCELRPEPAAQLADILFNNTCQLFALPCYAH